MPVHLQRRLKKLTARNVKVEFLKQVPSHPRDRLKRTAKSLKQQPPIHPCDRLKNAGSKLRHPRNRTGEKEAQIGRNNASRLMRDKFDFSLAKILNKTWIFGTLKINEEEIMDSIIDALNDKYNDECYIEHPESSNYFTLKRENGQ